MGKETVQPTTAEPDPLLLDQLAQTGTGPLDEKVLKQHGGTGKAGNNWIATHAAGTGAYTLTSDQPDNEVGRLRARTTGAAPPGLKVEIRVVADPSTLAEAPRSARPTWSTVYRLEGAASMQSVWPKSDRPAVPVRPVSSASTTRWPR